MSKNISQNLPTIRVLCSLKQIIPCGGTLDEAECGRLDGGGTLQDPILSLFAGESCDD